MKYAIQAWKVQGKPDKWHVGEVGEIELFHGLKSKTFRGVSPMFDRKEDAQKFMRDLKTKIAAE